MQRNKLQEIKHIATMKFIKQSAQITFYA